MSLVLDTGVILASVDAGEAAHERCTALLVDAQRRRQSLLLPALVLSEVAYMLERQELRSAVAAIVDDIVAGGFHLVLPTGDDFKRALDLEATYRVGLTDATVAALAERSQSPIATLDRRHFTKLRTARGRPFKLVP